MDTLWKATGLIIVTVILGLSLEKTEKDISVVLSMTVCIMVSALILTYMKPVITFLQELSQNAKIQEGFIKILVKSVGIALISELSSWLCIDAGNNSLGKTLQILSSTAILYISLPVYQSLLTLIREILGEI